MSQLPALKSAKIPLVSILGLALSATLVAAPRLSQAQTETVLYSLKGQTSGDGAVPIGPLMLDRAGNIYGSTFAGGVYGYGTVFKLAAGGRETILHSFSGGADGGSIYGGLVADSAGNLYGATYSGGQFSVGTVFKVDPTGVETVLHSFSGIEDGKFGWFPESTLLLDSFGNLYGTAMGGTLGSGALFRVDVNDRAKVIYSFGTTGASPSFNLIRDAVGNFYGTTYVGGVSDGACYSGCGTVFKLDTSGQETVLYNFTGGPDGDYPSISARDSAGNLYGTTHGGATGFGTVFKLTPSGEKTLLYDFAGGSNAQYPGLVVLDGKGGIYGTAAGGIYGYGTVYHIDAQRNETVVFSFKGGAAGKYPNYELIRDSTGNLYGTTELGGDFDNGVIFKIAP